MTSAAAVALCLTLPLPLLSPSVALLSLSLLVLGACNATLDVAMNAQAVAVEQRYDPVQCGRTREGVEAGTTIAAVATTGYLGFLAGPPLIGLAAEVFGMPMALG